MNEEGEGLIRRLIFWVKEKVWLWVWGIGWQPVHQDDLDEASLHMGEKCMFCDREFK